MGHQLLKEAPANEDQRKASLDLLDLLDSLQLAEFQRVSTCFNVHVLTKVHDLTSDIIISGG